MYRGDVVTQKFTGGELSWNTQTKTFTTVPPELAGQLAGPGDPGRPRPRRSTRPAAPPGGPLGPLGAAKGAPYPIGARRPRPELRRRQDLLQPRDRRQRRHRPGAGQVRERRRARGRPRLPDHQRGRRRPGTESRMSSFAAEDQPVIFWTPDYGAVIVRGAMNAAWDKLGGATGALGAPMADQTENGDVITQKFSGGVISWDSLQETSAPSRRTWRPRWPASRCRDWSRPRRRRDPHGRQIPTATSGLRGLVVAAGDRSGAAAGRVWWRCGVVGRERRGSTSAAMTSSSSTTPTTARLRTPDCRRTAR